MIAPERCAGKSLSALGAAAAPSREIDSVLTGKDEVRHFRPIESQFC
jgi:hypothetical protein